LAEVLVDALDALVALADVLDALDALAALVDALAALADPLADALRTHLFPRFDLTNRSSLFAMMSFFCNYTFFFSEFLGANFFCFFLVREKK
jgi:hypothetical protein